MALKSLLLLALLICLAGVAVLTCSCKSDETPSRVTIHEVTPQEAFDLIQDNQNNSDFLVIDVRTSVEFAEGHIKGAINIDYYRQTFSDEIGNLDRDKTYLVYCRTGNRSTNALHKIEELGFKEIYHLSDGIVTWNEEGLPVVK